jgi:hypothetical protein
MDCDDKFYQKTKSHWIFGKDMSGDLLKWETFEAIWDQVGRGTVDLITADGAMNSDDDYNEQEAINFPLILAECVCSIHLLSAGSTLVVKMFTQFEDASSRLCWQLRQMFGSMKPLKPKLSKPSNGEFYMVCRDYWGEKTCTERAKMCAIDQKAWDFWIKEEKMRLTDSKFLDTFLPRPEPEPENKLWPNLDNLWTKLMYNFQSSIVSRQRKYINYYLSCKDKKVDESEQKRRQVLARECWKQWNDALAKSTQLA